MTTRHIMQDQAGNWIQGQNPNIVRAKAQGDRIYRGPFSQFFGGPQSMRHDLINRGAAGKQSIDAMRERWAGATNPIGQNPYQLFYRKGQNAFVNEAPKWGTEGGQEWKSRAVGKRDGKTLYGWYQTPGATGPTEGPTTADQDLAAQIQANPMHAQSGAGAYGGMLGPLGLQNPAGGAQGGMLGDATTPPQAVFNQMYKRPLMQQAANPYSPYNYMPMMPSSPMDPSMTSQIGGEGVTHNIPYLSSLYQTQMNQPTQQANITPSTTAYNYGSNPGGLIDQNTMLQNMENVANIAATQASNQANTPNNQFSEWY